MPQVSDTFSAYPVSVVLDGSGNGTVRFQATGKNIRITNLYVAVSTATLQAKCTMYKGQIAASSAIKTTNSGSTGSSATGNIALFDGEAVYVVWTGGDPGATATATFSGSAIPFELARDNFTEFLWDDPIAAGDGTLIYPGLQSVDFVQGISGWRIDRDGNAEFNDATIRGELYAGNGTVQITELGVYVTDDNSTQQYVILRDGGFVARNTPDDGAHTQMYTAGLAITRPTTSPNGFTSTHSRFDVSGQTVGAEDFIRSHMNTGTINGQNDSNILLRSEGSSGTPPYAQIDTTSAGTIDLTSAYVNVQHRLISGSTGMDYPAAQLFTITFNLTLGGTGLALGSTPYPVAFPSGTVLFGYCNINSGSASVRGWVPQWLDVSNTNFNLVVRNALAGGGPAAVTVDIDIAVFAIPT